MKQALSEMGIMGRRLPLVPLTDAGKTLCEHVDWPVFICEKSLYCHVAGFLVGCSGQISSCNVIDNSTIRRLTLNRS